MTTVDLITALFYHIDQQMHAMPKHPEAHLWPSEVVTLGLLHALKGVGNRPFYRWLTRDYRALFPRLPERTRLFRLLKTHQDWARAFLASPTVLGVIDTYGIELVRRESMNEECRNARWYAGTPEPMDLSSGDHPHCEQHGPKKRSEGEASSQEGVQAMRRQVNQPEA